jgi:hypothetical protein
MDLHTLANLAQVVSALAVVAAIVFGLIQVRQFQVQRRDTAAVELMRSFLDAQFGQALRVIASLPNNAKAEQLCARGAAMEEAALYFAVRFEAIGLLVFRGNIPLSLVGELIGGIAINVWSKVHDWVAVTRKEQSREHFCEWFQWLAEQLHKVGRLEQSPAFLQHRDWSPPPQ